MGIAQGCNRLILPRRVHRRLAWLALIAIMLTSVMPTVSRVVLGPMPMAMAGMAHGHGHGSAEGHAGASHGMPGGSLLDACGYCSLFCHVPLHMAMPPALALGSPEMPPPAMAAVPESPVRTAVLAARPRAPPRIVDV